MESRTRVFLALSLILATVTHTAFAACHESCDTCVGDVCGCTAPKELSTDNLQCKCPTATPYWSEGLWTCTATCPNLLDAAGTRCVAICPDGEYADTTTKVCTLCKTGCATCSDDTACTTCDTTNNYVFPVGGSGLCVLKSTCAVIKSDGTQCLAVCPDGEYADTTTKVCTLCKTGCATCSAADSCDTCAPKYFKDGTVCTECGSGCATCSVADTCDTCMTGYAMDGTACVLTCPETFPLGYVASPSCTEFTLDKTCQLQCAAGYAGVASVATCEYVESAGKWTGASGCTEESKQTDDEAKTDEDGVVPVEWVTVPSITFGILIAVVVVGLWVVNKKSKAVKVHAVPQADVSLQRIETSGDPNDKTAAPATH